MNRIIINVTKEYIGIFHTGHVRCWFFFLPRTRVGVNGNTVVNCIPGKSEEKKS